MQITRSIVAAGILGAILLGSLPAIAAQQAARGQGQEQAQGQGRGQAERPAFKKLTRAELDVLLARPESVLIIDVRRPDELAANGGFPAYLSIQAADLGKSLAFIPKDRAIVTVSNRAGRAGRAAALLTQRGFTVAGGIGALEYEEEGGTLTKVTPPAPRGGGAGNVGAAR